MLNMLSYAIGAKKTVHEKKELKSIKDMLMDSIVIGAIAAIAVWDVSNYEVIGKAFFAAFVVQMAVERGLKR